MNVTIINGPMGVGKTTVGKCIADQLEGTAFIDGDWCLDIHPFVGNQETKSMAIDNILHMMRNYQKCSVCQGIVLVWLMDEPWVLQCILDGIAAMGMDVRSVTLICNADELIVRWKNDRLCPWRTDEWLNASLASLPYFASLNNCIDTSGLSIDQVASLIINH